MRRYLWLAIPGAVVAVLGVLLLRGWDSKPTKTETDAQTQVDSAPQWKREAADSQRALDSLAAGIQRVRADSARVARVVRQLRHRKDSLQAVTAGLQANLDSIPALLAGATASDSSDHWSSIAIGQGHVIRTMAEEIEACRAGDEVFLGRIADLEGGLSACQRRAAIFESRRNQAQIRLDRNVRIMERMIEDNKHADDWNLPLGIHLPGWTKCIVAGAAGGGLGALVDNTRGAALGGGAALSGCLVS